MSLTTVICLESENSFSIDWTDFQISSNNAKKPITLSDFQYIKTIQTFHKILFSQNKNNIISSWNQQIFRTNVVQIIFGSIEFCANFTLMKICYSCKSFIVDDWIATSNMIMPFEITLSFQIYVHGMKCYQNAAALDSLLEDSNA